MKKTSFFIAGRHAVIEAIRNPLRKIHKIYITDDAGKILNKYFANQNKFKDLKKIYRSKKELDNLCGKDEISHQGMVADIEEMENLNLNEFIKENEKKNMNILALEDVTDPRNIGSVIRTCAAFGLDGLIINERTFPSKSKVLYKSSSGGIEYLPIFKVSNIKNAFKILKKYNFWISAFDNNAKTDFSSHKWNGRNVLLFGSEGIGIKQSTLKHSDYIFNININKKIESLNISNSVAIVSHFLSNYRK